MEFQHVPMPCGACKLEWTGKILVQAPLALASAAMLAIRCPTCRSDDILLVPNPTTVPPLPGADPGMNAARTALAHATWRTATHRQLDELARLLPAGARVTLVARIPGRAGAPLLIGDDDPATLLDSLLGAMPPTGATPIMIDADLITVTPDARDHAVATLEAVSAEIVRHPEGSHAAIQFSLAVSAMATLLAPMDDDKRQRMADTLGEAVSAVLAVMARPVGGTLH